MLPEGRARDYLRRVLVRDPTAEEVRYTNGQCHALAIALHEEAGWGLAGAGYDEVLDPDYPGHVVALTPEGEPIDILGAWYEELWGAAAEVQPMRVSEVYEMCADDVYPWPLVDEARETARRIIREREEQS